MTGVIRVDDYDKINEFCELVANQLFPKIRSDVENGVDLSDMYATLINKLGDQEEVDKSSVMWGSFVACIAIAKKLQADENARRLAT